MYIQQLKLSFPPPTQNTVEGSNQITLLILYYIHPRLVKLLKFYNTHIQVSDIFHVNVSLKFFNFSFQMFLPFVPEMSISFNSDIILLWIL